MNLNRLRVKDKRLFIVAKVIQSFEAHVQIKLCITVCSHYFNDQYTAFKPNRNSLQLHETYEK